MAGEKDFALGLDLSQLVRDAAKAKAYFNDIGDTTIYESERIKRSFNTIGSTVAKLGGAFALEEMARGLYNFSASFDKAMREVGTISTTVSGDMESAKAKILSLTTEIPIAADEAAKALYQIASAGYDGADGMNVLEVSAKAAIGGVTDTATAADAITTLLNAYKMSASDAEGVSDMLFTTVKLGKTTMGELGQSVAQVAPLAAAFGVEMDQVLAGVATLTKSGTPTAQAMTQIRAALTASTKVLGDGYYATHTFQEGLATISEMAGGSESKLRELIPEIEGMNGVLGMTGINATTAASDLNLMNNALGSTTEAVDKMIGSSDNQLQLLRNNALQYFSDLGDGIMDSVGSIAGYLNDAFESGAIENLANAVIVLVSAYGAYKGAVIAATAVTKLQKQIMVEMIYQKKLVAMAGHTLSTSQALAAARTSLLTAAKFKLVTALKAVKTAMLTNPWTALFVVITTIVTAIIAFNDGIDSTTKKLNKQKEALEETKTAMKEVSDEMAKNETKAEGAKSMAERYDELKKKVNLSKSELQELNTIVTTLSGAYPDAITKVNQYGDAVEISSGKVLKAIELERELLRAKNADTLDDAADNAGDAYRNFQNFKEKADQSRSAMSSNLQGIKDTALFPDRQRALKSLYKNNEEDALQNEAAAQKSLETLYSYVYELERGGDTLEQAVQRINEESNLNLSVDWVKGIQKSIEDAAEAEAALVAKGKKTTTTTTQTESEEEKDARLKRQKEVNRLRLKYAEEAASQEIALERSRISDKNELLLFDYVQTLAAIKKEEDAYKAAGGTDTSSFESLRNTALEQYLDATVADLDKQLITIDSYAEQERKKQEEKLKNFQTFAERYQNLQKQHEENLELIEQKGGTNADVDAEDQRYEDSLQSLNDEVLATIGDFESLGIEATDKVIDQMIERLQKAKTDLENNPSGADNSAKIAAVNAEIERCIQLKRQNDDTSQSRSLKEWQDMESQLKDCNDSLQDVGDSIGGVAGEAIKTASGIASSTISMVSSITQFVGISTGSIKTAAQTAGGAIAAVEKASVILAIIGAVIQVATKIANLFSANKKAEEDHQKALLEITERNIDAQTQYNALLREEAVLLAERNTIFGDDPYNGAIANTERYSGAIQELRAAIKGSITDEELNNAKQQDRLASFFGMPTDAVQNLYDSYNSGLKGLNDIEIVTGSHTERKGLFGWGKKQVDDYSSITSVYSDLVDQFGNLNTERAQIIIGTQKMSDEDKKRLEGMIALQEEADDAIESINDYYRDIFGDMGSSLKDALVDAFRNGTDAGEAFCKNMVGMLEKLGEDFAYSMSIGRVMAEQQKEIDAINKNSNLTDQERADKLMALAIETGEKAASQQDEFNAFLEAFQQGASKDGYKLWEEGADGSRTATSTSGVTASQDSVNENTALQRTSLGITSGIYDHIKDFIVPDVSAIRETMSLVYSVAIDQLTELRAIRKGTDHLEQIGKDISEVKENTASTRKNVKRMYDDGVKSL